MKKKNLSAFFSGSVLFSLFLTPFSFAQNIEHSNEKFTENSLKISKESKCLRDLTQIANDGKSLAGSGSEGELQTFAGVLVSTREKNPGFIAELSNKQNIIESLNKDR